MIYLDYSATTPVNVEVLDTFNRACLDFVGNPNSLHSLGIESAALIAAATKQISDLLGVSYKDIIYTSGASESNNMAIKGIAFKYSNRGKHIITTRFEHSSIYGPTSYLQKMGFDVDFVDTDESGIVDIQSLISIVRDDTILVSIASVNSEIGIRQPIEEIGKILKEYPKCFFHVDATQSVGKEKVDFKNVDLVSFSAHKFYGIKGIGVLIKKDKIELEPLIHGGKSTTVFRSGTPQVALIASMSKALRLAYIDIDKKHEYLSDLNAYLRTNLASYERVHINSNNHCIPHILNFSVIGVNPETLQHALEEYDIFISTQTACSTGEISQSVMALTNNEEIAKSSVRVSLSYLTKKEEIDEFLKCFAKCYESLTNLR